MKRRQLKGRHFQVSFINESATEFEVHRYVDQLNGDPHTHGIIVTFTITFHLDEDRISSRYWQKRTWTGSGPPTLAN
ncbi:ALI_collapsed_G0025280.mRNA.1.CDS.1 [Saccharomyces cerevisiae]|nr:ALI_collapsed_G0025280.mRNA.1.CDS.1 [Saccharomyces cerevisiae]